MSAVVPPDLEAWLVGYLRQALTSAGLVVEVDNKEPSVLVTPLEVPLVVVRDDSGPQTSRVTYSRQVGIFVLAGARTDDEQARGLSRRVMAIATDPGLALVEGSPVAAVDLSACRGPWAVDDPQDVARRYVTVGYSVVGSWS